MMAKIISLEQKIESSFSHRSIWIEIEEFFNDNGFMVLLHLLFYETKL